MSESLAKQLGYGVFSLSGIKYTQLKKQKGLKFDKDLMVKHRFVPFFVSNAGVKVAISNFDNLSRLNEYQKVVEQPLDIVWTEQQYLDDLLEQFEHGEELAEFEDSLEDINLDIDEGREEEEEVLERLHLSAEVSLEQVRKFCYLGDMIMVMVVHLRGG